jgi:heme-degrading monooxygenase HmoA
MDDDSATYGFVREATTAAFPHVASRHPRTMSVLLSYLGTQQGVQERRGARAMMTVVTTVTLKDEARNQWDRAMHERVRAASDMEGWVAVQLLREVDEPRRRAIIGTWESREHWARWHDDEAFKSTRAELAGLEDGPPNTVWYDVVEDQG